MWHTLNYNKLQNHLDARAPWARSSPSKLKGGPVATPVLLLLLLLLLLPPLLLLLYKSGLLPSTHKPSKGGWVSRSDPAGMSGGCGRRRSNTSCA